MEMARGLVLATTDFFLSLNYETLLELVSASIHNILEKYINYSLILGGDYNSRIGNLNQSEEILFYNTSLTASRITLDQTVNKKGREFNEIMKLENLIVINGRTISYSPANYTYVSKNGKSVLDLILINPAALYLLKDLSEITEIILSDHL